MTTSAASAIISTLSSTLRQRSKPSSSPAQPSMAMAPKAASRNAQTERPVRRCAGSQGLSATARATAIAQAGAQSASAWPGSSCVFQRPMAAPTTRTQSDHTASCRAANAKGKASAAQSANNCQASAPLG